MLKGKKILLGICGSIAAYKAAILVRELVKQSAEVKVVMTPSAVQFISPLSLSTLSKNDVLVQYSNSETGSWNNHVELALWADVFVVAPATANTISKMANGACDNLLLATYLSAKSTVLVAPAMDLDMWLHPATVANVAKLRDYGNLIIEPTRGELASGLVGTGRMEEPIQIVEYIHGLFESKQDFVGKKVLVTAGPTYEKIDPVRFIGNFSTGKMGYSLALEFAKRGAKVTLVSGPSYLEISHPNISRVNVLSASDMLSQCVTCFSDVDIAVMNAAVADYTPKSVSSSKIKKKESEFSIELTKTTDVLATLGKQKKKSQFLVGFALETDNEQNNALKKLQEKNLDFIVLNSLRNKGAGFEGDTNQVSVLSSSGEVENYPLKSKTDVAKDICDKISKMINS